MTQQIISEQKNVRLSFINNNAGRYYSVATKGINDTWYTRNKYKPTHDGFEKALILFYRLILCEIDANIIIDIDNDFYTNL